MKFGSRKSLASRAGFTLVELLVVISIIGMLMALLFPAINAARESGRQNTCRNNMRTVMTALISYESSKNTYPSLVNNPNSPSVNQPLMYMLFPYLERMDLYRNPPNDWSTVPIYLEFTQCPSNPLPRTDGFNSFVFNSGTVSGTNWNSSNPAGVTSQNGYDDIPERNAGMFFQVGANSSADLTAGDGATSTLMISENLNAGKWYAMTEASIGFTWGLDDSGVPTPTDDYINSPDVAKVQSGKAPSSNHPTIVNVAFADSHVRVLSDTTPYAIYAQLCTPNGTAFGLPRLSDGAY